jgi:hypothetical protein
MKSLKAICLILISALLTTPLPCQGGQAEICAVVLKKTELKDLGGNVKAHLQAFTPLDLIAKEAINLEVAHPAKKGEKVLKGYIPASSAVLVPGSAADHEKRLGRIKKAILPKQEKLRLVKGILKKGDTFPKVEMAWGKPQRSFMVNFFSDEEHYVYFRPEGKILLRFKGGLLSPPLPKKPTP